MKRVLYLHGFASSVRSRKAQFFERRLAELGASVEVPDLARGDFEHLTITGQLKVVEEVADGEPVTIVGSSLGGYLAALYAAAHPEVERLILLAPAFHFVETWRARLTEEQLSAWRKSGSVPVFHYGEGRPMQIGYQLIEDASRYANCPIPQQPVLIFHGDHDPVVPVSYSVEFVAGHPNRHLMRMNSGHELTDVLDQIWEKSREFLAGES